MFIFVYINQKLKELKKVPLGTRLPEIGSQMDKRTLPSEHGPSEFTDSMLKELKTIIKNYNMITASKK